jgi:hypothetical protein
MQLENRPNSASTSSSSTRHKGKGLLIYTKSSSSDAIQSVSLLLDNRFLLATTRVGDLSKDAILEGVGNCPVLAVYDLDQLSASQHQGVSSPIVIFSLNFTGDLRFNPYDTLVPHFLRMNLDPGKMELYYRFNIHSYSDEVAVPFFSSPSEQLIGLRTNGFRPQFGDVSDDPGWSRILLIPIVKLTSHIDGAAADNVPIRIVPWKDWGASTGWAPDSQLLCWLRGSLQVSSSRIIPGPPIRDFVDVWDFSRARVAQLGPQHCRPENLPCVQTRVALPKQMKEYHPMGITEDAVVCQVCGVNLVPIARLIDSHCGAISTGLSPRHISSFSRVLL